MGANLSRIASPEELKTGTSNNDPETKKLVELNEYTSEDSGNEDTNLETSNESFDVSRNDSNDSHSIFSEDIQDLFLGDNEESDESLTLERRFPDISDEESESESTMDREISKRKLSQGESHEGPPQKKQKVADVDERSEAEKKKIMEIVGKKIRAEKERLRQAKIRKWMDEYTSAIMGATAVTIKELEERWRPPEEREHSEQPRWFRILMQSLIAQADVIKAEEIVKSEEEPMLTQDVITHADGIKTEEVDKSEKMVMQAVIAHDEIRTGEESESDENSTKSPSKIVESRERPRRNSMSFLDAPYRLPSDVVCEMQVDESKSIPADDVDEEKAADEVEAMTIDEVVDENKGNEAADEVEEVEFESFEVDSSLNEVKSAESVITVESQEVIDVPSSDEESPSTEAPVLPAAGVEPSLEEVEDSTQPCVLVNPFFGKKRRGKENAKVVEESTSVSTFQLPETFDMKYLEITIAPMAPNNSENQQMSESIKIRAKNSEIPKVKKRSQALTISMKKSRNKKFDAGKKQKEIVNIDLVDSD